jgi:hypothetical protein
MIDFGNLEIDHEGPFFLFAGSTDLDPRQDARWHRGAFSHRGVYPSIGAAIDFFLDRTEKAGPIYTSADWRWWDWCHLAVLEDNQLAIILEFVDGEWICVGA